MEKLWANHQISRIVVATAVIVEVVDVGVVVVIVLVVLSVFVVLLSTLEGQM